MVSIGPYSESLNFTHQFDLHPAKVSKPKPRNSLWGLLQINPEFSAFKEIVKKAKLDGKLDDPQTNLTLFVPSNSYLNLPPGYLENMDTLTARKLVNFSCLNRKISLKLIKAQPVIKFITKLPTNKLYVTNLNCQTVLHGDTILLYGDIEVDNGLIHVIDKIMVPTTLSTASYYSQAY